jgi:transcription initiation factor IIE alpha subunit
MLSTTDILATIEEGKTPDVKQLAKKLEIQVEKLEKILEDLNEHNLVEYDQQAGKVKISSWLINIDKEIEDLKPATGMIILPKNQEIKLQDVTIGNFTEEDLELNVKLRAKEKEIAICKIT